MYLIGRATLWLMCELTVSLVTFTAIAEFSGGARRHELNSPGELNTTMQLIGWGMSVEKTIGSKAPGHFFPPFSAFANVEKKQAPALWRVLNLLTRFSQSDARSGFPAQTG